MSDFANTRSVVVGHFSMYTFNLNLDVLCRVGWGGIDCSPGFFSYLEGSGGVGWGFGEAVGCLCLFDRPGAALLCWALYCMHWVYAAWYGVAGRGIAEGWHGMAWAWHTHIAWRVACRPQWRGCTCWEMIRIFCIAYINV